MGRQAEVEQHADAEHKGHAHAGAAQNLEHQHLGRALNAGVGPDQRSGRRQRAQQHGDDALQEYAVAPDPARRQSQQKPQKKQTAQKNADLSHHRLPHHDAESAFESLSEPALSSGLRFKNFTKCIMPTTRPRIAPAITDQGAQSSQLSKSAPKPIGATISRPIWLSSM